MPAASRGTAEPVHFAGQIADESGQREILGRDLAELKHQVAALQSRISDIEQRLGG